MKNPTEGMFRSLIAAILCNLELKDLDFDAVQAAVGAPKKLVKVVAGAINTSFAKAEPPPPSSRFTQTFEVEVDYDDPDNRIIPKMGGVIYYVDETLKPKHFPIRGKGKSKKVFRYLEFDHEPTTQEMFDETKRHSARNPDFAETRAFHKANPGERDIAPVLSLCGEFEGRGVVRFVANVCADGRGLGLYFDRLRRQWNQRLRVLVVCESV